MIRRLMLVIAAGGLMACTPQDAPADPAAPVAATQPTLLTGEVAAPEGEILVTSPAPEAIVSSPLVVEGFVQNNWMFEGVFPVTLEIDGKAVAEAPGQQQAPDNWTNPGPVKFRAELTFTVDKETAATLVFKEDMPRPVEPGSDVAGPARTLRVPVTLAPPTQ